jgi:hypothetical protein
LHITVLRWKFKRRLMSKRGAKRRSASSYLQSVLTDTVNSSPVNIHEDIVSENGG